MLVGTGRQSAKTLEMILSQENTISHIVEVGGAGVSKAEKQGVVFEATKLIAPDERTVLLPKKTEAPEAHLFTVKGTIQPPPANEYISLYTQETYHLFLIAKKNNISFTSLRVATDSGENDVRERFVKNIQASRKDVVMLINQCNIQNL